MVRIKVPATSANMGPGFDSLGIAVGLYNTIELTETGTGFTVVTGKEKREVPVNDNNMIYRAITAVFDKVGYNSDGVRISQKSSIPVTRGLGSSSACIIGGMLGANVISGRKLSYNEILDLAASMEGHPDNVTPALYGGFCTSVYDGGKVYYTSTKIILPLKVAVMFPDYPMQTREARKVVPDTFSKKDTVYNISRAAMLVSALSTGKFDLLKIACKDKLHQQYRLSYISGGEDLMNLTYDHGAYATYLSGSGPSLVSFIDSENDSFARNINNYCDNNLVGWKCRVVPIDNVGSVVLETNQEY